MARTKRNKIVFLKFSNTLSQTVLETTWKQQYKDFQDKKKYSITNINIDRESTVLRVKKVDKKKRRDKKKGPKLKVNFDLKDELNHYNVIDGDRDFISMDVMDDLRVCEHDRYTAKMNNINRNNGLCCAYDNNFGEYRDLKEDETPYADIKFSEETTDEEYQKYLNDVEKADEKVVEKESSNSPRFLHIPCVFPNGEVAFTVKCGLDGNDKLSVISEELGEIEVKGKVHTESKVNSENPSDFVVID